MRGAIGVIPVSKKTKFFFDKVEKKVLDWEKKLVGSGSKHFDESYDFLGKKKNPKLKKYY